MNRSRTVDVAFEHEIEEFDTTVEVEASVTLPHPRHAHPNDPNNDGAVHITRCVLPNGEDLDFDRIAFRAVGKILGVTTPTWKPLRETLEALAIQEAER